MRGGIDIVLGLSALAVVVTAAVLEGAVVRVYGGACIAAMACVGILAIGGARGRTGGDADGPAGVPSRPAWTGILMLVGLAIAQALPWPDAARRVVAPGMAQWLDRVGRPAELRDAWLAALATADLETAIGATSAWTFDVLQGAREQGWRIYAARPDHLAWIVALFGAAGLAYVVGRRVGRAEGALRAIAVGLVLFGVAEAIFGIANRSGPSTGIGVKQFYIGSATGTLINRGHFAALLCLSLGAAWGLAAQLFPLVPEEVRRHAARKNRSSQPPSVFEVSGDRLPRLALLAFVAAVLSLGLVAANSRGPLLGFAASAAAVAAFAWRVRGERWHVGIAAAVPIVGVTLAALAWGPRGAVGRFVGVLGGDDISVTSRLSLWRESLDAFLDAPLLGWGLGAWNTAWPLHERAAHVEVAMHAHSEPVEWLVEGGAIGVAAVGILVVEWLRATARDLRAAPAEDPRVAVALGLAAGVGAIAVQSLADFPLRTPAVTLAFGLCAGLVHGALRGARADADLPEPDGVPAGPVVPSRGRAGRGALLVGALGTCALGASASAADAGFGGSREARVGEVSRGWYAGEGSQGEDAARAWREVAQTYAERHPLDPWAHAAVARAASALADVAWKADGGTPEDLALEVEQSLARVRVLRGTDPRLAIVSADALVHVGRSSPTPDAYRARAEERLAFAVSVDAWRAQDAFEVAAALPVASLARISTASDGAAPTARARVRFEHGRALERRRLREAALAEHRSAAALDPAFGPPWFAAGAILRAMGDTPGANAAFEAFLTSRDRPLGMEGWAALFLDRLDLAEARLRAAEAQDPRNRWAIEGLVQVARERGDASAEVAALRRIAALAPGDSVVRDRIRALETGAADPSAVRSSPGR